MDETNFNLHISRRDGRSLKGRRYNVVSAGTQSANIHVIGSIGPHGLVKFKEDLFERKAHSLGCENV